MGHGSEIFNRPAQKKVEQIRNSNSRNLKGEIRSTNTEIRNKFKIQMFKGKEKSLPTKDGMSRKDKNLRITTFGS